MRALYNNRTSETAFDSADERSHHARIIAEYLPDLADVIEEAAAPLPIMLAEARCSRSAAP